MSTIKLDYSYRCWNDCRMEGCPTHIATIEYQSVSDALHFTDGKGAEIYMQTPELGGLLHMLCTLGEMRVEVQTEIDNAFDTSRDAGGIESGYVPLELAPDDSNRLANFITEQTRLAREDDATKWKSICGCPMCEFHCDAYAFAPKPEKGPVNE